MEAFQDVSLRIRNIKDIASLFKCLPLNISCDLFCVLKTDLFKTDYKGKLFLFLIFTIHIHIFYNFVSCQKWTNED